MSIDTFNTQAAVRTALITLCDGRIYDDVPAPVTFPYIEIGEAIDTTDDTSDTDGVEQVLSIRVWSRYRGHKEVKGIVASIRTALNEKSLTVIGAASCLSFVDSVIHTDDPDGVTRLATVRVRLIIRE